MPRVSVVIPYFNAHATLAQTLRALDAQSFRDFETILVDDGSTAPESHALLESLSPATRVLRQANRGLPAARNAGIAAAAGTLVLPLDSDDLLEPAALARLVAALDADPAAELAFSWTRRFGDEDGVNPMAFNPFEQLFVNEAPYCMLMRRTAIDRVGGYDESLRLGHEDWEFNIRLVAAGARAAVVREPLFLYRVRADGLLKTTRLHRMAELWRMIRDMHPRLYRWRALVAAWRRGRREESVWPLPVVALWAAALMLVPARAFNPIYRAVLRTTRRLRDRWKMRLHGTR